MAVIDPDKVNAAVELAVEKVIVKFQQKESPWNGPEVLEK